MTCTAAATAKAAPTIMATAADVMTSEAPIQEDNPLEGNDVESLLPESIMKDEFDLERMTRRRSSAKIQTINVTNLEGEEENEWDILRKEEHSNDETVAKERKENDEQSTDDGTPANTADEQTSRDETSFASRIKELPEKGQELIQVASCINSFDTKLLQACTSVSEQEQFRLLGIAAEKGIVIKQDDENGGVYVFSSNEAQTQAYELIPLEKRSRFHASIGRNLVRKLSHEELETHVSLVLLQFRRGLEAITSQTERNAIAALCLRAIRWAVAESDFRAAACNYAELGIELLALAHDCWKDEYDLSLALYNSSAEVFLCIGDYERTDAVITVVLDNARCYRDTLQVRATRVHSLSSQYRMPEALEESLDVLAHLGERFPSRAREYHVAIAMFRTRRLVRAKTNEAIMRMPLMENSDKVAALQILNLAFPIAYRTNPLLNALFASRMVQLTMKYGLSAISPVGFASFSSMLATFYKNKEDGFRCSQLALDLLNKFDAFAYIPRVYVFVYAEVLPYKLGLRELSPFLLEAYHKGLETGDIQVSFTGTYKLSSALLIIISCSVTISLLWSVQ
jgi:predicted ATPase